ncbi:MAG: hypothetical protein WA191_02375, partial [Telluria sp.]
RGRARPLRLRRHGARRQQAGEGYNDESVFQGNSRMKPMISDSTLKAPLAYASASRNYLNCHFTHA